MCDADEPEKTVFRRTRYEIVDSIIATLLDLVEHDLERNKWKKRFRPFFAQEISNEDVKDYGKIQCISTSSDGQIIFLGHSNGLSVVSSISHKLLAYWQGRNSVEITILRSCQISGGTWILGTVDDLGIARFFLYEGSHLVLAETVSYKPDDLLRTAIAELTFVSRHTLAILTIQKHSVCWLEIRHIPKVNWLKQLKHMLENIHNFPDFNPTTVSCSIEEPTDLSVFADICMASTPSGNHSSSGDGSPKTKVPKDPDLRKLIPSFYLQAVSNKTPKVISFKPWPSTNLNEEKNVCLAVWWDGNNNLFFHGVAVPPTHDVLHNPLRVWPHTDRVVHCAISHDSTTIGVALYNGVIIIRNLETGFVNKLARLSSYGRIGGIWFSPALPEQVAEVQTSTLSLPPTDIQDNLSVLSVHSSNLQSWTPSAVPSLNRSPTAEESVVHLESNGEESEMTSAESIEGTKSSETNEEAQSESVAETEYYILPDIRFEDIKCSSSSLLLPRKLGTITEEEGGLATEEDWKDFSLKETVVETVIECAESSSSSRGTGLERDDGLLLIDYKLVLSRSLSVLKYHPMLEPDMTFDIMKPWNKSIGQHLDQFKSNLPIVLHPEKPFPFMLLVGLQDGSLWTLDCDRECREVTEILQSTNNNDAVVAVHPIPCQCNQVLVFTREGCIYVVDVHGKEIVQEIVVPWTYTLSQPWKPQFALSQEGKFLTVSVVKRVAKRLQKYDIGLVLQIDLYPLLDIQQASELSQGNSEAILSYLIPEKVVQHPLPCFKNLDERQSVLNEILQMTHKWAESIVKDPECPNAPME